MEENGGVCTIFGREKKYTKYFGGKTWSKRDKIEFLGVGGKIISEWIIKECDRKVVACIYRLLGDTIVSLGIQPAANSCGHVDEVLGSTQCG
jgi:hypothetical protein